MNSSGGRAFEILALGPLLAVVLALEVQGPARLQRRHRLIQHGFLQRRGLLLLGRARAWPGNTSNGTGHSSTSATCGNLATRSARLLPGEVSFNL